VRAASAPLETAVAPVDAAAFEQFLLDTQKKILADAEKLDGSGKTFITDRWERGSANAGEPSQHSSRAHQADD